MKIYNKENLPTEKHLNYMSGEIKQHAETKHLCIPDFSSEPKFKDAEYMYGPAITRCYEQDGILYVTNDEYQNPVLFCPFCGFAAKDLK